MSTDQEIKHGMVQSVMVEYYKDIFGNNNNNNNVKVIGNIVPIWNYNNKKVIVLSNDINKWGFILDQND